MRVARKMAFVALAACKSEPPLEHVDPWVRCPAEPLVESSAGEAPIARFPYNGYATGSVWAPSDLAVSPKRPRFRWEAVPDATTYELEADDSCPITDFETCAFPSPELSVSTGDTQFTPAEDLPVSTTPPVGTRYVWRVRACDDAGCGPWSRPRYLDVGRSPKDFDGDGYADVVVGAPLAYQQFPVPMDFAFVALYAGSPTGLDATPTLLVEEFPELESLFGFAVAAPGDVNGDGYADLLVAARDGGGELKTGIVFLYLGGPSGPGPEPSAHVGSRLPEHLGEFGASLAGGDVDGDGYADVVVGAPREGDAEEGRVWVWYGTPSGLSDHTTSLGHPDDLLQAWYGHDVSVVGDTNGDGFVDVLVGAPYGDPASFPSNWNPGLVTLHRGGEEGLSTCHVMRYTPAESPVWSWVGLSVAGGDFDGDGYADLLVGSEGEKERGLSLVHVGGPQGPADDWTRLVESPIPLDAQFFGTEVACVGDVDADGYDDALLGMKMFSVRMGGQDRRHGVFAYPGSPSGLADTFVAVYPDENGVVAQYGTHVAGAGDINGDGHADALISGHGEVEVFHGTPTGLPATPDLILVTPEPESRTDFGITAE